MLKRRGAKHGAVYRVFLVVALISVFVIVSSLYTLRDTTRQSTRITQTATSTAAAHEATPPPIVINIDKCPHRMVGNSLTDVQKSGLNRHEVIACTLKLRKLLMFCGSFEDLRHALTINTKYLLASADLYNKDYDFHFPPLTDDYLFTEEYGTGIGTRFMDDLASVSRTCRATYTSLSLPVRPLVIYIPHEGVSDFYNLLEQRQYAVLRAELVKSTIILVSQGVDDVASSLFGNYTCMERFLEAPYLRMWFSQNCDIHHPKVRPLPIGTNHHFSEATPTFNRSTLAISGDAPYLKIQQSKIEYMIKWLKDEGQVLQGLDPVAVPSKWRIIEECDTEMLEGTQRLSFDYRGAHLAPCLLKELGDRCEILLLAANIRSMSAQDRCGVMGRDRSRFEQVTGLAGKPQLSVFLRSVDGRPHTVYLPLVDLYYIFMTSTLGHSRRKMRIFGAFGMGNNRVLRSQAAEDLNSTGLGDYRRGLSRSGYRGLLGEYAFTASPIGNGYDCHRTWEALLAGSIPIVNSPHLYTRQQTYNSTALADILADLPIFVVDSYRNITEDTLKAWAREAREKAARGEYKFEKLFSYHYMNEIRKLF